MNNKILSIKRYNAIFLATILVLGTLATISPSSFMVRAQADSYLEMDTRYDSYEPIGYPSEYTDNNNYEPSEYTSYKPEYPSDNSYKSKDSSSTIIKKVKCNNINQNFNGVDVNLGIPNNDALVEAEAADNEGQATTANGWGNEYKQNDNGFKFVCINNNDNVVVATKGTTPEPPIPNPRITVIKEMFICNEPTVIRIGGGSGFNTFFITCQDTPGTTLPDPNSPVWIPWEDCDLSGFCENFSEENFTIQIEQNPGPNFIRYEFPGTNEGRTVNVESGTYQISEQGNSFTGECSVNPSYEGSVGISNPRPPPQLSPSANFCFTLEGDCSGTIEAGEEKTCTVNNYLVNGLFELPIAGMTDSNTNIDTSDFDISTSGGLTPSFSSPPTIAQGTTEEDLTALEKITKLKQQWLELLP